VFCLWLQYLGWRGAALMTPLVCLAAGAVFFAGSLFPPGSLPASGPVAALLALGPIAGIMVQVILRIGCTADVGTAVIRAVMA
jgi:ATP/ADP translocase